MSTVQYDSGVMGLQLVKRDFDDEIGAGTQSWHQ